MTAKLTQWYFAFIVLAFQLITFAHCQNWPVSVCYLQGACTCDNDLPEKATTVNCDCAKASATMKNLRFAVGETSFPRLLNTIRVSNCDSLTVAENAGLPPDISEFFIKSVNEVIIHPQSFKNVANLTIQDIPQLKIVQMNDFHTMYASNIFLRNVSMKCHKSAKECLHSKTRSQLTVSTRFEAVNSNFGDNTEISIRQLHEKSLSVIITNCTAENFRADIVAHTVDMRRNRFSELACDVLDSSDSVNGCTNTSITFTGSLKLAENYYKNMMMPDLVIDGSNITLDLYPDRELKNSIKTTARAAQRFLMMFYYMDKDDGGDQYKLPDGRVVVDKKCRTSSSKLKPKYRNSSAQYTCTTPAELKKRIRSDDFLSDFSRNFAEYQINNSPTFFPSHASIPALSLLATVVALLF